METNTDQSVIDIPGNKERAGRASSTKEVVKDLERREGTTGRPNVNKSTPLFPENEATNFRNRWTEIQALSHIFRSPAERLT